jgi:hypothetical protein
MSLITKPNRAYAVGETKSQNAVIKVYSVADLKRALTQVYQLPNGVGTIEIATDITITEPIKLRQFAQEEVQPREIIIQGVSGTRIINGNKTNGTSYNYNQTGNSNIPVFDFEPAIFTEVGKCKYTFKDLIFNSQTAKPFGSIIAADVKNFGTIVPITLQNIKANNIWNIFAAYDPTGSFPNQVRAYGIKIDDFKFSNYDSSITEFSYNSVNFASLNAIISNVAPQDFLLATNTSPSNNYMNIWNVVNFVRNSFINIFTPIKISVIPPGTSTGDSNTTLNCNILPNSYSSGFSHITAQNFNGTRLNQIFESNLATAAHNIIAEAEINDSASVLQEISQVTKTTFNQHTNGSGAIIVIDQLPPNGHYEIDWVLAVKYDATGLTNNYHIKSTCRVNGSGIVTLTNNSTIYAFEEVLTLTGIIPTVNFNWIQIAPSDPTPLEIDCSCNITITGLRMPIAYL